MSLTFLASFLGALFGAVITFLLPVSMTKKKSVHNDIANVHDENIQVSMENQPRKIEKIELPERFVVEDEDLHLQFERVDISQKTIGQLVEFFTSQGYQEVNDNELSQNLAAGLQRSLLEKYKGVIALQALSSIVPLSTVGYSIFSITSTEGGLYRLAHSSKVGEELLRYSDGTYASFMREANGRISEHVGFEKISGLKINILAMVVWYIGNLVFSTINFVQINQNLEKIQKSIKAIIDKMSFEKLGQINATEKMLIKLMEMQNYHYIHLLEVKQYYKELLGLYEYFYTNIKSNREIKPEGILTSTKVRNVQEALCDSKILGDLINMYRCIKLLKISEIIKLKILYSLKDNRIFQGEFLQTLSDLEDDIEFKNANEIDSIIRQNLLTTLENIANQAIFNSRKISELQEVITDYFSNIDKSRETAKEIFELGKKIAQNFKKVLSSKIDIVYIIQNGQGKVLMKLCE